MHKKTTAYFFIIICTSLINAATPEQPSDKTTAASTLVALKEAITRGDIELAQSAFTPEIFMHNEHSKELMTYMQQASEAAQEADENDPIRDGIEQINAFLTTHLNTALVNAIKTEQYTNVARLLDLGAHITEIEDMPLIEKCIQNLMPHDVQPAELASTCEVAINMTPKHTPDSICMMREAIARGDIELAHQAISPDIFMHGQQSQDLIEYMHKAYKDAQYIKMRRPCTAVALMSQKVIAIKYFLCQQSNTTLFQKIRANDAPAVSSLLALGARIHNPEHIKLTESFLRHIKQNGSEQEQKSALEIKSLLAQARNQDFINAVVDGNVFDVKMCLKQKASPALLLKKHPRLIYHANMLTFVQEKVTEHAEPYIKIWNMLKEHPDTKKILPSQNGTSLEAHKKLAINIVTVACTPSVSTPKPIQPALQQHVSKAIAKKKLHTKKQKNKPLRGASGMLEDILPEQMSLRLAQKTEKKHYALSRP